VQSTGQSGAVDWLRVPHATDAELAAVERLGARCDLVVIGRYSR